VLLVLTRLDDAIWTDAQPVRIVGMRLCANMTVLRLPNSSLLLHSPISMTPERREQIAALGRVAHLYAPNLFHHLHLGEWSEAFPEARVSAPALLAKKRPDLRIDRVHGAALEPALDGVVDEVEITGCRLGESVLFHRASRTLLAADLVHNIGRPAGLWERVYTRTMGFHDQIALSRVIRWTAFSDRKAARRSIDRVLELPFERLLVGHGAPINADAKQSLRAAFTWLA
jgi:hypothetical protein